MLKRILCVAFYRNLAQPLGTAPFGNRGKSELQLLIAELKDRDRELGDMVDSC